MFISYGKWLMYRIFTMIYLVINVIFYGYVEYSEGVSFTKIIRRFEICS